MSSHRTLQLLTPGELMGVRPDLRKVVENRKSGLSLNHIIGCPLDCAYCVRHEYANFDMKQPHAIMSDQQAVTTLLTHPYFTPDLTPIQLFNRATDPFLPAVKEHTFAVLQLLSQKALSNHVLLITRFRVTDTDASRLNSFAPLRITLLITYSGIDDRSIEPLGYDTAIDSLHTSFANARRFRVVLYWRPIIQGLNDTTEHLNRALQLSQRAHATVFTGLFYRDTIRQHFTQHNLPQPYESTARRKILPRDLEQRILAAFDHNRLGKLFRKTSCAVAYAHSLPDYNGHYGIREICSICPSQQIDRCASAFNRPAEATVAALAIRAGAPAHFEVGPRAVVFDQLDEQQRYFIQHALGYQVHDKRYPHHTNRHGRAEIGWEEIPDDE